MTILTFLLVIVGLAYLIRLRARTIELENRIEQLTLDRATNAQLEALRARVIALERASPPRASQPAPTAQEFVAFLRAAHLSGPASLKPSPIELFLASHPAALAFVQAPKPVPVSFAKESFFAVNAYKFINASGVTQFGRYRIVPEGTGEYLDPKAAAAKSTDFLFDEIRERLAKGPIALKIMVQLAAAGDVVDDSTIHWPEDRPLVEFGTLELRTEVADNQAEQRHIIFDPIPRVDGIESSGDPLLEPRADVYLMSGRRRRGAAASLSSTA